MRGRWVGFCSAQQEQSVLACYAYIEGFVRRSSSKFIKSHVDERISVSELVPDTYLGNFTLGNDLFCEQIVNMRQSASAR